MTRRSTVEEFLAKEKFKADRKRLIYEAKAGRSLPSLKKELADMGGNFTIHNIRNWVKSVTFRVGIEAEKINDINETYEGLEATPLLNAMVCLMHTSLEQLIIEFAKRNLSANAENPISTKDLGTIISNFSARIIAASVEAQKLQVAFNYRAIAEAMLEEVLRESEATYSAETPESLPIVSTIVRQVRTKFEFED